MTNENIKPDSFAADCEAVRKENGTDLLPCPDCFDCSFGAVSLDKLTEEQKEHIRPFVERTFTPKPIRRKVGSPWGDDIIEVFTWYCECGKKLWERGVNVDGNPQYPNYCEICGVKLVGDD